MNWNTIYIILSLLFLVVIIFYKLLIQTQEDDSPTPENFNVDKKKIYSGERLSCAALREITGGEVLENYRPDFLKNPETKRNLELDCYSPSEAFATEFQGEQHYRYPNKFHKTLEEFEKQLHRDVIKQEMCKKEGVKLIYIPFNIVEGVKPGKKLEIIKAHIIEKMYDFE